MQTSLATVTLLVDEYERGIAFCRDGLGLSVHDDVDMGGGKRWVTMRGASGARLVVARASDDAQQAAVGNQAGGRVAFFLETDDFDASAMRLEAAGARFLETPRDESYGRVAVFADPFGNKWNLIAPRQA